MRHVHFVQSTEALEGGGLGHAAYELSEALDSLDQTASHLLTTTGSVTTLGDQLSACHRIGPTKLFFAPSIHKVAHSFFRDADVIHGHGFYNYLNYSMVRSAIKRSLPLVYHVHGIFDPWILRRSRIKKRIAHILFENRNFRYATAWRALTGKEVDQIRSVGIRAPVILAPNGIKLSPFENIEILKTRLLHQQPRKRLLFLGRIHPKKGLVLLIKALCLLPKQLLSNWELAIYGPDEDGHQGEVQKFITDLGLEEFAKFHGVVRGANKIEALASADAFVLTSFSEGFTVALLEASAASLPCLYTTECNFPDLEESGGGIMVQPELQSVTKGLRQLLCFDDREFKERGRLARRLVEEKFTWGKVACDINLQTMHLIK
jgi:glycosyltransferase involved in cell wall biosynthesis